MRAPLVRSCSIILFASLAILTICGSARTVEIHIVGDVAYKYVDGEWVLTTPQPLGDMRAVWAFAEDDLYANDADGSVNQLFSWMRPLNAVHGTGADNVYAVGEDGYAYRYDGDSWNEIARPCEDRLIDVYVLSETEIYALDDVSRIYHYNGVYWAPMMGGMDALEPCKGICGTSSSNLYAAGGDKIYRWDGVSWQIEYQNSCPDPYCNWTDLRDIWVSSTGEIFAVGSCAVEWSDIHGTFYADQPLVFHYDGIEWTTSIFNLCATQCPDEYFEAVYGTSEDDVVAVGLTRMYHYDGGSWNEIVNGDPGVDVWIASDGAGYVVYENFVQYATSVYSFWYREYFPSQAIFRAVWGADDAITADTPRPKFELTQNHPNPFNPSTTIRFSLRERGRASLAIYDVAGRLVRVLADDVMDAGPHDVTWDGKDRGSRAVASGVYFYRLETGVYTETKKMVLLR